MRSSVRLFAPSLRRCETLGNRPHWQSGLRARALYHPSQTPSPHNSRARGMADVPVLLPGMVPFPKNVFDDDQPWLNEHLLPLISIDLGVLRPELAGVVPTLMCPLEPFNGSGYIGEETVEHHNEFTGPNWFAFELTDDNRMRFMGNKGYFRSPDNDDDAATAQETRDSYAEAEAYFKEHGRVGKWSQSFLDQLGGEISDANWICSGDLPKGFECHINHDNDDFHVSFTRDGNPFFLVAAVAGYKWLSSGADAIVMMYEPETRTVLFSFDWT